MIKREYVDKYGVLVLVIQGRTHYQKSPRSIPKTEVETSCGSSKVTEWKMTPEQVKAYFAEKYPDLEKTREMRKNKIW